MSETSQTLYVLQSCLEKSNEENARLRARCERYEKVLKQIKDWCHGDAVVYSTIALEDALDETEHKHHWTRRRDGRWCQCGEVEFGVFETEEK